MPKMTPAKRPSKVGFLLVVVLCAGAVFGVARYVELAHASTVPASEHRVATEHIVAPVDTGRVSRNDRSPFEKQTRVAVVSPVWHGTTLDFTSRGASVPSGVDPKVYAVNEFLSGTKIADPAARLLSVDIRHGVASLYFNGAMEQTFGTDDENVILNGLLATMAQFSEVQKVDFFANGKKIDSFGNVDLSEPQPVHPDSEASSKRSEAPMP